MVGWLAGLLFLDAGFATARDLFPLGCLLCGDLMTLPWVGG